MKLLKIILRHKILTTIAAFLVASGVGGYGSIKHVPEVQQRDTRPVYELVGDDCIVTVPPGVKYRYPKKACD